MEGYHRVRPEERVERAGRIARLREQGLAVKVLSLRFGLHPYTIRTILKKGGEQNVG